MERSEFNWGLSSLTRSLFNRDEIFVAFISSGLNFEEQRSLPRLPNLSS
jgi:hypothetical protein